MVSIDIISYNSAFPQREAQTELADINYSCYTATRNFIIKRKF